MNPLFFGASDRQLYGVYHPPQAAPQPEAVLLCAPFGQEYMRSHRAYRQLALMLSKRGRHVLRFDYFGTGDSAGDGEDFRLPQAIDDIALAAEELRDMSDARSISLVGLRLGAALALAAAARVDAARVVLWDPVVRGRDYLAELLARSPQVSTDSGAPIGAAPDQVYGVNGFPITPALRSDLDALDLLAQAWPDAFAVRLVASNARDEFTALAAHLRARGNFEDALIQSHGDWNDLDDFGGVLLHSEIVRAIVGWIT